MDEMDGVDTYKREQGLVVVGIVVEFLVVVSVVGLLGLVGRVCGIVVVGMSNVWYS